MLKLEIKSRDGEWDEEREEFVEIKGTTLQLEHSLVSLSKWESIWHKPFLYKADERTDEELKSYIQCMNMTQNVDPAVFDYLTKDEIKQVMDYIQNPMTATWFKEDPKRHGRGGGGDGTIVTSEYLYYLMIEQGVPFDCQKWHLNRLMTLLRVCTVKRSEENKKISPRDQINQYAAMKAARRMKH